MVRCKIAGARGITSKRPLLRGMSLVLHCSTRVLHTALQPREQDLQRHPAGWLLMRYGTTMTHVPAMERYRVAHSTALACGICLVYAPQPHLLNATAAAESLGEDRFTIKMTTRVPTAPLSLPSIVLTLSRPPVCLHHVTHCSHLILYVGMHAAGLYNRGARDNE